MQLQAVVAHEVGHIKCEHGYVLVHTHALSHPSTDSKKHQPNIPLREDSNLYLHPSLVISSINNDSNTNL